MDLVKICFLYRKYTKIRFIGRYCADPAAAPVQCPPGYAQLNPGQVYCDKCPAGTYTDKAGMAYCLQCPPGFFCPESSDFPLLCPTNKERGQEECHTDDTIA